MRLNIFDSFTAIINREPSVRYKLADEDMVPLVWASEFLAVAKKYEPKLEVMIDQLASYTASSSSGKDKVVIVSERGRPDNYAVLIFHGVDDMYDGSL